MKAPSSYFSGSQLFMYRKCSQTSRVWASAIVDVPWGLFMNLWTLVCSDGVHSYVSLCFSSEWPWALPVIHHQSLVLPLVFVCPWTGVISANVWLKLKHFQLHFLSTCLSTRVSLHHFLYVRDLSWHNLHRNTRHSPHCGLSGVASAYIDNITIARLWLGKFDCRQCLKVWKHCCPHIWRPPGL